MINLIPPSAKKAIIFEYYTRAIVVVLCLILSVFCITAVLALPPLVLVELQETAVNSSFADIKNESDTFAEATKVIKEANKIAGHIDSIYTTEPLMPVVVHLQALAPAGIQFSQLNIARGEDRSIATVTVGGQADTRESLALFRDLLRNDGRFEEVTLPLSNLAKNEEVPFNITMGFNATK